MRGNVEWKILENAMNNEVVIPIVMSSNDVFNTEKEIA